VRQRNTSYYDLLVGAANAPAGHAGMACPNHQPNVAKPPLSPAATTQETPEGHTVREKSTRKQTADYTTPCEKRGGEIGGSVQLQ